MTLSTPGLTATARGVLWAVAATAVATCADVLIREVGGGMDAAQMIFLRSVAALAAFGPLFAARGVACVATRRLGMHLRRGLLGAAAFYLMIRALTELPLAEASALFFTESLFALPLAALLLAERIGGLRWLAATVGFGGVLVVLRPGLAPFSAGAVYALGCAFFWALSGVLTRDLARGETTLAVIFWALVIQTAVTLVPALAAWQPPSLGQLAAIGLMAFLGEAIRWLMIRSYRLADASVVSTACYSALPFGIVAGFLVYGEIPDAASGLGIAAIAGAVLLAARSGREAVPAAA